MRSGVVAVVLAAGISSRFGAPKQLEKLGRSTLLERTLSTVRRSNVDRVILVLGHQAEEILSKIDTQRAEVIINKEYASGLSSSLRAGLGAVGPDARAVLLVLADQPFLSVSTINRMIEAYTITRRPIVVPLWKNVQGNPVLFDRSFFDEVAHISGDVGAKQVILKHPDAVLGLKMRDPRHFIDVDTREDLERIRAVRRLKPSVRRRPRNRVTDAPRPGRPS